MKTIPRPWLVFNEKVKTGTVIIRDSTAISDTMLLLFGGKLSLVHKVGTILNISTMLFMLFCACGKHIF